MLRTDVDVFLDLVRRRQKISLVDAAKELHITQQTIQAWTDFLVEEKILGIEYKFTTPYVYMNIEQSEKQELKNYIEFDTKEEFYEKAKNKGLNAGQVKLLWLKYVNLNKSAMRRVFYEKSKSRGIDAAKVDELWKKYMEYLEAGD
jgi:hypothetical protein